jgi:hypothetical protein
MPQIKHGNFNITITCNVRPEHAKLALQIIVAGAASEIAFGKIVHALAPAQAHRMAKIMTGHESDAKKLAAFQAVAAVSLHDDSELALLNRIVAKQASALKLRNPFAHSSYGHTDDDPDLLLLVNTRDTILWHGDGFRADERTRKMNELIFAYTLAEMQGIIETILSANNSLALFEEAIAAAPSERARQLAQLEASLDRPASPSPQAR